jgi:hypothetical protein
VTGPGELAGGIRSIEIRHHDLVEGERSPEAPTVGLSVRIRPCRSCERQSRAARFATSIRASH